MNTAQVREVSSACFQLFLPGIARNQVPFVEKGRQRSLIFITAC
jgi:hypothetical protein